ncbi:MAG TPA: zinc-dependent alcohol dehydrogenase family protein [Methylophilaceae bacterium]|nr:zinc-dependent alcohol dehydrogenase family protein [Methylophilaceae bacterium]
MKAMLLERPGEPLVYTEVPDPVPSVEQVLLRVLACGVCRTDLHVIDGELADPVLPLIPGHEIVGEVIGKGSRVNRFSIGDRVGVPWLGWTCGECAYCDSERENLCDEARFTGYQINGGYAEMTVADQRYCFPMDKSLDAVQAAPLLCAGLIGYRALKLAGYGQRLGIYGFGAAAHIVTQLARYEGREVYAFTRENDHAAQQFARSLGAVWAGSSAETPPQLLEAALIFAPVGALVPAALQASAKGATVVCAGIHMSDIPSFSYDLLWSERVLRSVANLTRADGEEFLSLASKAHVATHTVAYPLNRANEALADLRAGKFNGAAVLVPGLD